MSMGCDCPQEKLLVTATIPAARNTGGTKRSCASNMSVRQSLCVSAITGRERELDQSFHQIQRSLQTFRDHQK
jgi:hypothetical protein